MTGAALCVGINEFEYLPLSSRLYGCVNDADDIAAFLTAESGFADSKVTVLHDAQATKSEVVGALTDLVGRAERGDMDHLVFSYSSHGTQVPDSEGDEPDRADEALAAYDIRAGGDRWHRDTVIVDDELNALLAKVPASVLVEVVLDTCHSGTGLKSLDLLPGRRPKFLPPPTPLGMDQLEGADPVGLRDLIRGGAAGASEPILFAACRADQTASDATFGDRNNGAFTHYFLEALNARRNDSRKALVAAVAKSLRTDRFSQKAQLEASAAAKKLAWGIRA
jgi:hypothetical protein